MTAQKAIELLKSKLHDPVPKAAVTARNENEAINMAISALEKQIPKKPEPYSECGNYEGKCVSCGVVFLDRLTKYCGNCGQRLDWGKEDG